MRPIHYAAISFIICSLHASILNAQEDTSWCKVKVKNLVGTYTGDCKLGLADGKGDAKGVEHYTGNFKMGFPNGNGVYYYNDTMYHSGDFQDGLKEGKGETHYVQKGMPDSVIKGYWSGDVFRGKKYVTYSFSTTGLFDFTEITPSNHDGNTITIELGTTSGTPNGSGPSGVVLSLVSLVSPTASILKMRSKMESSFKSYATFELVSFPCKLFATLNSNETFELELYKAADWKVRLFKNK
jgi:hypothetical protein